MIRPVLHFNNMDELFDRLSHLEGDISGQRDTERKRTNLVRRDCAYCDGTGQRPGPLGMASPVTCNVCRGRAYNLVPDHWVECGNCGGTGKVIHTVGIASIPKKCTQCLGKGWVPDNW